MIIFRDAMPKVERPHEATLRLPYQIGVSPGRPVAPIPVLVVFLETTFAWLGTMFCLVKSCGWPVYLLHLCQLAYLIPLHRIRDGIFTSNGSYFRINKRPHCLYNCFYQFPSVLHSEMSIGIFRAWCNISIVLTQKYRRHKVPCVGYLGQLFVFSI